MLLRTTSLGAGLPSGQSRMSRLAADFRPLTALIRVWQRQSMSSVTPASGRGRAAAGGDAAKVPRPVMVGPEMTALSRFYRDVTWEGVIREGGMGPGTPAMTGKGQATARAIQDGRWIVLDCEQEQFLADGTFVLKWELHWVSGWVPEHGEYRAVMTDNYGHAAVYRGRIDGDRLIFESLEDAGARLRLTWDASGPDVITWRNEMTTGAGTWFLIEEYRMVPR